MMSSRRQTHIPFPLYPLTLQPIAGSSRPASRLSHLTLLRTRIARIFNPFSPIHSWRGSGMSSKDRFTRQLLSRVQFSSFTVPGQPSNDLADSLTLQVIHSLRGRLVLQVHLLRPVAMQLIVST